MRPLVRAERRLPVDWVKGVDRLNYHRSSLPALRGFDDLDLRVLIENVNTCGLMLYDIANNQITGSFFSRQEVFCCIERSQSFSKNRRR
jgi:hypothetical protein